MNNYAEKHRAFAQALVAWKVEKTTERYTELLAAHADMTKGYADTIKFFTLAYGVACVVTTVVSLWSILR